MKTLIILVLFMTRSAFAADIECAVQTRDENGVSSGPPKSIGILLENDYEVEELFIKQENFNLLVVRAGPTSVSTGIYDFKNEIVANTEEAPVKYKTYAVVQDFFETGETKRSAAILCKQL